MNNLLNDLIRQIDIEIEKLQPPMDDYDAGTIEGLRTARAMIMKRTDIKWDDIHGGSELSEFRAVDGGNF
jgi:hypothetical protein